MFSTTAAATATATSDGAGDSIFKSADYFAGEGSTGDLSESVSNAYNVVKELPYVNYFLSSSHSNNLYSLIAMIHWQH